MTEEEFTYLYKTICEVSEPVAEYSREAKHLQDGLIKWNDVIDDAIDVINGDGDLPGDYLTKLSDVVKEFRSWIDYNRVHLDDLDDAVHRLDATVAALEVSASLYEK